MIFLLLYCSTSPQAPAVQYNQDGSVVLPVTQCSSTPVYEDIDAYRVGFNKQGIPSGVLDQGGVNWCEMVWCSMVWCLRVWCSMVWCLRVWCSIIE